MAVQECSKDSVQINSVINSFIELKKLTLSNKKCSKIHVGKVSDICPDLKIHSDKMRNSKKEKYLGDQLSISGKVKETIEDRVSKGYGIVTEILAILDEIPLGQYRLEMGLKLREAMFLNGVLFNSEAWHALTTEDIKPLERVDESLLRSLLQGHPKAPLEFLYLETGTISISHLISSRRMMYVRTLLRREEEELTLRIYREQQRNTSPGDFAELVKDDFERNNLDYDEDMIASAKEEDYRKLIRRHVRETAFKELKNKQASHSKVNTIVYEKLEKQSYLVSSIFTNDDVSVLSNLRSHTTRGIRSNFQQMYRNNLNCPLKCWPSSDNPIRDTQEHLLTCSKLKLVKQTLSTNQIKYDDIYGNVEEQKAVVTIVRELLEARNTLLNPNPTSGDDHWTQPPPGAIQTHSDSCENDCSVCIGN